MCLQGLLCKTEFVEIKHYLFFFFLSSFRTGEEFVLSNGRISGI